MIIFRQLSIRSEPDTLSLNPERPIPLPTHPWINRPKNATPNIHVDYYRLEPLTKFICSYVSFRLKLK